MTNLMVFMQEKRMQNIYLLVQLNTATLKFRLKFCGIPDNNGVLKVKNCLYIGSLTCVH